MAWCCLNFQWAWRSSLLPLMLCASTAAFADSFAAASNMPIRSSDPEAFQWCQRPTLSAAKKCALDACERSADGECDWTIWCEPGAWSGVLLVTTPQGQKHLAVCGHSKRRHLMNALKNACGNAISTSRRSDDTCVIETIINPGGDDIESDVLTWQRRSLGLAFEDGAEVDRRQVAEND